jgi:hypothetical protein
LRPVREVAAVRGHQRLELDVTIRNSAHRIDGAHDHLVHMSVSHEVGAVVDHVLKTSPHLVLQTHADVEYAAKLEQALVGQATDFVEETLEQSGRILFGRRAQQIRDVEEVLFPG